MNIQTLNGSFGFDTMLNYGDERTFIGDNPINGTWYVNMNKHSIVLSITDKAGNSVYASLSNDDFCLSGLEASILIKKFFSKVKRAVKNGNRMSRERFSWINGREIKSVWTTKTKDQ